MSRSDRVEFLQALAALRDALERLAVPWTCLGGVAVIARGVGRYTADIDATVVAEAVEVDRLLAGLEALAIRPRVAGAAEFARQRLVALVQHEPTRIPIDISMAWLPFEREAITFSEPTDFGGVLIPVPRIEHLIVYKLVASRPKDLQDAESLLAGPGALPIERMRATIAEFAQALDDDTRVRLFDQMVARTRAGGR